MSIPSLAARGSISSGSCGTIDVVASIEVGFIDGSFPHPVVGFVGLNGDGHCLVGIATLCKTVAHHWQVPALVVAPCVTFAPQFHLAIVFDLVKEFLTGLVAGVALVALR